MGVGGKRILYVVNDAAFFLSYRLPIARAAKSAGYDIHVATPEGNGIERIKNEGFVFHPLSLDRCSVTPGQEIASLVSLYRLYRDLKPDLVHHVTIKPILYGSMMARLAGVRSVVNDICGLGYVFSAKGWKGSLLRLFVKSLYRLALGHKNYIIMFQNPDDQELFLKLGLTDKARSVLIKGAGVDLDRFTPSPEPNGVSLVVLASRMLWHKGIGEFVEAARILSEGGIKASFVLVGGIDPCNPAAVPASQLENWNKSGVVQWQGWRGDMPQVFAKASIICLPSYYREGVPSVLIEAAASGRPIVTTDAPGCREIVRNEENGLLVPVRNAVALAAALQRLIENPHLRRQMGAKGREIAASGFSLEKVVNETLEVYRHLLKNKINSGPEAV